MKRGTDKNMKWITRESDELFRAILALKNPKEARNFFRDLLTENEIIEFSNRWKAARMLAAKIPYKTIEKETGLSSTTVARVAFWLSSGMNGYQRMLKRVENKYAVHHPQPLLEGSGGS